MLTDSVTGGGKAHARPDHEDQERSDNCREDMFDKLGCLDYGVDSAPKPPEELSQLIAYWRSLSGCNPEKEVLDAGRSDEGSARGGQ